MKQKRISKGKIFFILFLFAICSAIFWFINYMNFTKDVSVIIEEGSTPSAIISQIKEKNAIPYFNLIPNKILIKIVGSKIKTGVYKVSAGQSFLELVMKIRHGIAEKCSITFIPGKTIYAYKTQLEQNPDFRGTITHSVLEGEILPDTYTFFCGIQKNAVLKHAKEAMQKFLQEATANTDFATFYLKNRHEVIILASIVEKETSITSERNKIAAVFKNRLAIGMRLQTDPTVIYQESFGTGNLNRALTLKDLQKEGPYNTYRIAGLPIGAISNPSRESILAVLNPDETDAIYFVAKPNGNGQHNFARNYKEHLRNVKVYRKK